MKQIPLEVVPAFLVVCALASVLVPRVAAAEGRLPYPATPTVGAMDVLHGVTVPDPYRWLEDERAPEVQGWMKAQDDLTRGELAKSLDRARLLARLKELAYLDSVSAPTKRGNRFFLTRRHATKEKSVVYWKEGKAGEEKVLFDPNGWSEDGSVSLGDWQPSQDGTKVAYQLKENNSDEATLRVIDVATGAVSEVDVIPGGKYASASWTPDGTGFYYTWLPTDPKIPVDERPGYQEVRFHRLGEDPAKDRVVRERTGDPTAFLGAGVSRNGRWLVLSIQHGWTSNDVLYRDLADPRQADRWTPLVVGTESQWGVEVFGDRFFVTTNDGAPRSRVLEVDPLRPARKEWKEVVPERKDATLVSASVLGGRLALNYLKDAASLLEVRELDGTLVRDVTLPGLGTVGGPSGLPEEDEAYYSFESYTTPREIHAMSMKTGAQELWFRLKVPVDPSAYEVEQVFFPSKDGTRLSMFLVHRKGMKRDGTARAILYGYGGFQVSETPYFSAMLYPWLEEGGVWAAVNLRGGGEYGEEWHRDGMLLKKQNTFDDFLAAGEGDEPGPARDLRRVERRPPRRRRDDAGAEGLLRGPLRRAPSRHGPLPPLRLGADLDQRVRLGGRTETVRGAPRLLPLPRREEGGRLPGDAPPLGRQRRPGRPDARPQVRRGPPGRDDGRARPPPDRAERGPRRGRHGEGLRRVQGRRVRLRPRAHERELKR